MKSRRIKLSKLKSCVQAMETSGEFSSEFYSLGAPTTQLKSMDAAHLPENIHKHRYPRDNLGAYDETRVVLSKIPGGSHSDYINANWIHGYNGKRRYIVTQAPVNATIIDFYRMIWENNVHEIVMLASLFDVEMNKSTKYYPDDSMNYGEIQVSLQHTTCVSDTVRRMYAIKRGEIVRVLVHYHYLSWPDHSVPKDPAQLLHLIQEYKKCDTFSPEYPLLIHCSAGVGRTGSFVLADIIFDMAENEDSVDFLQNLCLLRDQRISMIEHAEQYLFSHKLILLAYQTGCFQNKK